ncbi:MAG TPA: LacI family DNA-binding transcriptional regulator [Candidatus Methylacidiphilales bacterium]
MAVSHKFQPTKSAVSAPTTLKKTGSPTIKTENVSSTYYLAQYLGLSEWTVSRAINGHPEVKAATRERILKAMDEIGFRPNPVARGLSGKAMGIVGVCFGNASNALMIDKITILEEFLREHHLRGVLAICPPDEESQIRVLADFKHLRLDGIVLIQSYIRTAQLRKLLKGIRCVHVDPPTPDLLPRIALDRIAAMSLIINHLYDLGHRSFGTLGFSSVNVWRWQGLVENLHKLGLNPQNHLQAFELAAPGLESYADGIELGQLACRAPVRPTAFIAINDRVAVGAMQAMRDLGLRVPEDVSVMGFDNLDVGQYLRPRLTTIDQQSENLMRQAGELLLTQLSATSSAEPTQSILIEPHLIIRDSTGPAPLQDPVISS